MLDVAGLVEPVGIADVGIEGDARGVHDGVDPLDDVLTETADRRPGQVVGRLAGTADVVIAEAGVTQLVGAGPGAPGGSTFLHTQLLAPESETELVYVGRRVHGATRRSPTNRATSALRTDRLAVLGNSSVQTSTTVGRL